MPRVKVLKVDQDKLEELAGEIGQSFRLRYIEDGIRVFQLSPDKSRHPILSRLMTEVKGLHSDPYRESFIYEALLAIQSGPGMDFEKHPKVFDLVAWLKSDADRRLHYVTDAVTFGAEEGFDILYRAYHIERMEVLDMVTRLLKRSLI